MGYTNSPLVSYTKISPNQTKNRNHKIDRITPHCYVGQCTVQDMAAWLCNISAQASANYGIGTDGKVGMFVEEKDRSWCSSSSANDNRAVTIECASDTSGEYAINYVVYRKLIDLMVDICQRNGKTKLIWFGDKDTTLNYEPKDNEMILTVHRWFANKACPGNYIYKRLGDIATEVTQRICGVEIYRIRRMWTLESSQVGAYESKELAIDNCPPGYTVYDSKGNVVFAQLETVSVLKTMSGTPTTKEKFVEVVGEIAKSLYPDTNILPSVVTAQCCLETGYGLGPDATELVKHNNLLGMKAELLNSTWQEHSVWDGKTFSKRTPEVYNGKTTYITDTFRAYPDYRTCILDYEMFLLNVKNSSGYKYRKVATMTSPKEVITAISKGGYATDPSYILKVLSIITENQLEKLDMGLVPKEPPAEPEVEIDDYYRVQVGAYKEKANAVSKMKKVKDAGFTAIIKIVDNNYKVQVGAFKLKKNAEKKLAELKAAGFTDAFITP